MSKNEIKSPIDSSATTTNAATDPDPSTTRRVRLRVDDESWNQMCETFARANVVLRIKMPNNLIELKGKSMMQVALNFLDEHENQIVPTYYGPSFPNDWDNIEPEFRQQLMKGWIMLTLYPHIPHLPTNIPDKIVLQVDIQTPQQVATAL